VFGVGLEAKPMAHCCFDCFEYSAARHLTNGAVGEFVSLTE
jgi:hypothetical protein